MTPDDIKIALKKKLPIVHNGILYVKAQAWRCTIDHYGRFISSLELVDRRNCVVVALADECEIKKDGRQ